MVSIHLYFQNLSQELDKKTTNIQARIDIGRYVIQEISELHGSILELTAATRSKASREAKIDLIRKRAHELEKHSAILNTGGVFEKRLSGPKQTVISIVYTHPNTAEEHSHMSTTLLNVFESIDTISRLLNYRDIYIQEADPKLLPLISEIRDFNANSFVLFDAIETDVNDILLNERTALEKLIEENDTQHFYYSMLEAIILIISALVVIGIIYKILQQIVNLYKELENQLYIDGLTKLRSRSRLLKDIKDATNPSIVLIDINSFRTINELYGVDVGNEVLISFASLLRDFAKNRDFRVYRISGDEFVFFKDVTSVDVQKCTKLLDALFATMQDTRIFVATLGETLYFDISAGASFDKENPLGTADIALNRAKQLHKPYVIFHKELDSIKEIAHGALWKKKIIAGIQTDAFLPFFQPIVDKEQHIVKYEALMRFRQENGHITYITPFEFLEIASKTRHYNEISQMTLIKSLRVCAEKQIDVSLNLNYQDILNKPLHAILKERLIGLNIAHHVVFEIVESQNIQDYGLLKAFMAEFRSLGVRFAIDDFGTGFSNFTHIIELSPDYIKIDGSLIKHLDTDKTSYELVKAIVFFSKELGIQTIAEYVHSKEVFDVALELNIDLFQGYYFGVPQEAIAH